MNETADRRQRLRSGGPQTCYVTTAIPYVNASPHIGFAMEVIQADCLARHYRQQGHDVRLQAGADENSLKNVQAADAEGLTVEALVQRNTAAFLELKEALTLSFDDFIRTSSDARHRAGVEKLWRRCADNGDIYRRAYSGLYCTGCEQFYKREDLAGGLCPEHGTAPEEISEENYFFRLSRYQDALRRAITTGELQVVPDTRRNEVLAVIDSGLEDFSISRSAERARGWGIPVPGDPDQVIYVWFDALGNYITAPGYAADANAYNEFWLRAKSREHVIGKGIIRFHAIYWPAMLLSAGLPLPTRILVHGYVTVEGIKIGKSAGNSVDPVPLARSYGTDALRYFLLRHVRSTEDGDFSEERFRQAYTSELAGQLGNLANRCLSMIGRYCDGVVPERAANGGRVSEHRDAADQLAVTVARQIEEFAFHDAVAAVWSHVAQLNKFVTDREPWTLAKTVVDPPDPQAGVVAGAELGRCLSDLAYGLSVVGRCLWPILPTTAERLTQQLGMEACAASSDQEISVDGNIIAPGPLLFPRLES